MRLNIDKIVDALRARHYNFLRHHRHHQPQDTTTTTITRVPIFAHTHVNVHSSSSHCSDWPDETRARRVTADSRSERPKTVANHVRLIGTKSVHCIRILRSVDADGAKTELGCRAAYADGNLATVCHEELGDGVEPDHRSRQRKLDSLSLAFFVTGRAAQR